MTKEPSYETFEQYRRWIEQGVFCDMVSFDGVQLNQEIDRICNAALLSRNVEEAYNLALGLLTRERELSPTNAALLRMTYERLDKLSESGWLPVQHTDAERDITNHFPEGVYPAPIEKYLKSVAAHSQVDFAMAAAASLAAFAIGLQGRCKVDYPSGNGHTEHMCIYMLVIAEPSERKSSTFSHAITRPLRAWIRGKKSEYESHMSEYRAKQRALKNQLTDFDKKCKGVELPKHVESDMIQLQKELDTLERPVSPYFLLSDTTPEALGKKMSETGENAAVVSDEGCFLQTLAGRYSDGSANIDLVLNAKNGGYTTVNRITREDFVLERPLLSICLSLQPHLFEEFMNNQTLKDRGLVPRFLFCKPSSSLGYRDSNNPARLDMESYAAYENKIFQFMNLPQMPEKEIQVIRWERSAASMMLEYLQTIESTMKPDGILSSEKAYAGKAGGDALRIAGILHMIWTENAAVPISKETAYRAIQVHQYFFAEKIKDMQQTDNQEQRQAESVRKRLSVWTVQKGKAFLSVRDAYMKVKNNYGLKSMRDFENVLELLCNENLIDVVTTGKKRIIYVSPYWDMPENAPTVPTLQ